MGNVMEVYTLEVQSWCIYNVLKCTHIVFKFNIKSGFALVSQKYPSVGESERCSAWCYSSKVQT